MATDQKMLNCRKCGKPTVHFVQRPNHILHLLLSVFTLGVWLIVWFYLLLVSERPATCTVCGTRYKRGLFERRA